MQLNLFLTLYTENRNLNHDINLAPENQLFLHTIMLKDRNRFYCPIMDY